MALLESLLPGPEDAFGVGLVLLLLGVFLLANSLVFHSPRRLVAEHFGGAKTRLVSIRATIFQRLQVNLGFLFVLVGLALQLYGHYGSTPPLEGPRPFPKEWVGVVLLAVVALELGGWWLSHALFLRQVREHFRAHPPALEGDLALARELGELFGIASDTNDTVPSYLARVRRRLGLEDVPAGPTRAPARPAGGTEEGFV
jgi:hypothetical protein